MIPSREIKKKAREAGVPVSTVERDYAQNWLLKNLSSMNMALKGGTGIRKVYIENYRFSDDLDFTLLEDIEAEEIKTKFKEAVLGSREESGISFSEDFGFNENENGFEIDVYFQITQRGPNRTRIKIDLTKYGNEKILLPLKMKSVIHPYGDNLSAQIKVYSLEEIVAEKIRSFFQRTRPRDLYDVYFLWDKVNTTIVKEILPDKFKFKNVKLNLEDLTKRKEDFENAWINSLKHQLKELPEFDVVFTEAVERIKNEIQF